MQSLHTENFGTANGESILTGRNADVAMCPSSGSEEARSCAITSVSMQTNENWKQITLPYFDVIEMENTSVLRKHIGQIKVLKKWIKQQIQLSHDERDELFDLRCVNLLALYNGLVKLERKALWSMYDHQEIQENLDLLDVFFNHDLFEMVASPPLRVCRTENNRRGYTLRIVPDWWQYTPLSENGFFKDTQMTLDQIVKYGSLDNLQFGTLWKLCENEVIPIYIDAHRKHIYRCWSMDATHFFNKHLQWYKDQLSQPKYIWADKHSAHKFKKMYNTIFSKRIWKQAELQIGFTIEHKIDTSSIAKMLSNLKIDIAQFLGDQARNLGGMLPCITILVVLWFVMDGIASRRNVPAYLRILAGLNVAIALFLNATISNGLQDVLDKLQIFAQKITNKISNKVELQSASDIHGFIATLIMATGLLLGAPKLSFSKIVSTISLLPRFSDGLTSLIESSTEIFSVLKGSILDYFGVKYEHELTSDADLDRFLELTRLILQAENDGVIAQSSVLQAQVFEAEALGLKLISRKGPNSMKPSVTNMYAQLRKLTDRLGLRGVKAKGQRLAPIVISLYGKTNQGKSSMITTLGTKLLAKICESENIDKSQINIQDMMYARNSEQEFWDGYHGQLITIFDDFAQRRDFAQEPNIELFELVRSGNTFPYPLHMANLESKANTMFQSRIVILTTNSKKPKIESLTAPDAVYRRFDCSYEVQFDPQKCKESGLPYPVLKDEYTEKYDPTNQIFFSYDMSDAETKEISRNEPLTLDQIVDQAFEKYNTRFNFEKTRMAYDRKIAEECGFHLPKKVKEQVVPLNVAELQMFSYPWWLQSKQIEVGGIKVTRASPAQVAFRHQYNKLKQDLQSYYNLLKQKFAPYADCFKALAVVGALICGGALIKSFFFSSSPTLANSESVYEPGAVRASTKFNRNMRKTQSEAADNESISLSTSLIKKNAYWLSTESLNLGTVYFVTGRIVIMPRHYTTALQQYENEILSFTAITSTKTADYKVVVKDFLSSVVYPYENDELDFAMGVVPTAMDHRNIVKHIATEKEQRQMKNINVALVGLVKEGQSLLAMSKYSNANTVERVWNSKTGLYSEDNVQKFAMVDYWQYRMPTRHGDCGSLLVVNNNMVRAKLVGMHVMGVSSKDMGFSIPLYKEDIEKALCHFETHLKVDEPVIAIQAEAQTCYYEGEHESLGISPEIHITPSTSKIRKSPLHSDETQYCWRQSQKKPGILHRIIPTENEINSGLFPNEDKFYNPKLARINKYCQPALCVNQNILDLVVDAYSVNIKAKLLRTNESYKSEATFEEAVVGIHGDAYVNAINRKSSAGYGWNPEPNKPGKTTWFGKEGPVQVKDNCPVKRRVEETVQLAKTGKRNAHVFIDTLKDETKPINKALKPRVFSACSQDYYIACKMYWQGIVGQLTQNRIQTGIAVGINPYSAEWHEMVLFLRAHSNTFVAGDFEGFDSSLLTQVLEGVCKVLNNVGQTLPDWKEEHDRVRNILFRDLVNSTHCDQDKLYRWTHSLPSGHYLTAIVNSIYVNLIFNYLILSKLNISSISQAVTLCDQFRLVAYGDDHIISIPSEYVTIFNQNSFAELFETVGMHYTNEEKSSEILSDTRPIEQITFLKRSFRFEPLLSRYVAPLTLDTVLETPMWVKKSICSNDVVHDNVMWSIYELALHDQKVFNFWSNKIQNTCKQVLMWAPQFHSKRVEYIKLLEESLPFLPNEQE